MNDAVKAAFPNIELQNKKDYLTIEGAIEEFSLSTSTIYSRLPFDELVKAVKVTSGASQASALKAINRMHTMRN